MADGGLQRKVTASVRKDLLAGERVKTLRQSRHLTQDQLAKAAGVSRSLVAQWETGRSGFGTKVAQIAKVLEVPVRMLQPGAPAETQVNGMMTHTVSEQEAVLLECFRQLPSDDQSCLLHVVRRMTGS
jgi:transcriptional regulator with XRE-family HTH domain